MKQARVYVTNHDVCKEMSEILAQGFNAQKVPALALLPGLALMYGILRGTGDIIKECVDSDHPYIYCDHSFFSQTRYSYYRLIKNGRHTHKTKDYDDDRWRKLGIEVQPWRTSGKHIVVVPMSSFVGEFEGIDPKVWLAEIVGQIANFTDREILIKPKDSEQSLDATLANAHALVAYDSNAAVDAAIRGIPVFTAADNAAFAVSSPFINNIETPEMPERQQWLNNLAYQQFTHDEIKRGYARKVLNESN